jgi:hypothetical protein
LIQDFHVYQGYKWSMYCVFACEASLAQWQNFTATMYKQVVLRCDIFVPIQPTEFRILIGYWELLGGRDSSVGITTRYDLDGPEFESVWELGFPWPPRSTPRPTQPPVQVVLCHSQGKTVGAWSRALTSSEHRLANRFELYLRLSSVSAQTCHFNIWFVAVYTIWNVCLIVRFAPCVGKEVAKNGGSEQNKKPTSLFRTFLALFCFWEKCIT